MTLHGAVEMTRRGPRKRPREGSSPWEKVAFYGWNVTPSGCWEFRGCRTTSGYGHVGTGGQLYAHRVVYEHFHGVIADGELVLHSCDNPPCVNPAHLRAGTQKDNMHDVSVRKRWRNQFAEGSAYA